MNPYNTFYGNDRGQKLMKSPQQSPLKDRKPKAKNTVRLPSVKQLIPSEHSKYTFCELIGEGAFSKVY